MKTEIESQLSVFLATVNSVDHPYIQHRGGSPGFLHVLDDQTIAFAHFAGNRQFTTQGNLSETPKAHLLFNDHAQQRRTQAVLFNVIAWDVNCPQHIPPRFEAADVQAALAARDLRIAELEATDAAARRS